MNMKTYTDCWKKELLHIRILLKKDLAQGKSFSVGGAQFKQAARNKRPSGFDFSLIINNGKLVYNSVSVVGTNLWEVIQADLKTKELIAGKKIEIKMEDFIFTIKST
ncbi:hypothetical protein QWZ08_07210 [Ferruginibacter paludis]|uniref:hypothetical protein n=1 Tax=Ferruginibacter paludis TaxID=1310417 RepID=UPI0025B3DC77|nr:hypothetical protein [Ferruginibacter paludis]MDN3655406.1 hypothetical protein [Ferruginibacter paludis]